MFFKKKTLTNIMKDELDEAKLQLLQSQSRKDYYENMVNFYKTTIERLEYEVIQESTLNTVIPLEGKK